jgi:iron-sulfur cluster assembly protein
MLIITEQAADAIRTLVDPDVGGVRISLSVSTSNGRGPGLTVEPAPGPRADDEIIDADGLELYLDSSAVDLLDDRVLDAEDEGDAVRFTVHE